MGVAIASWYKVSWRINSSRAARENRGWLEANFGQLWSKL
jgi:hypothetical protein